MDIYIRQYAEGAEIPAEHRAVENLRCSVDSLRHDLDYTRSKIRAAVKDLNRCSDDEIRTEKQIEAIKKAINILIVGV